MPVTITMAAGYIQTMQLHRSKMHVTLRLDNWKANIPQALHAPLATRLVGMSREAHDLCDAPCSAIGALCSVALIVHAKEVSWQASVALFPFCTSR